MLDPATARLCVWRLPLEAAFRLFSKLGSLGGSIRERFSRTGRTRPALARPAFSRWLLENDRLRERWPCQWLNVLYFPFSETSPYGLNPCPLGERGGATPHVPAVKHERPTPHPAGGSPPLKLDGFHSPKPKPPTVTDGPWRRFLGVALPPPAHSLKTRCRPRFWLVLPMPSRPRPVERATVRYEKRLHIWRRAPTV